MPSAQPTGFGPEILQPFNIPSSVNAPIQKAPNVGLTFPVFTPPAASSYGTTNPMPVPWTPPDLAGAINAGIKTGAGLATDALTNRKSLDQIQSEEAAQKIAIAQAHAPGAGYYTSTSMGPTGAEMKVLSPAEVEMQRAEIANRSAAAEAERAAAAERRGETPGAQAELAAKQAETKAKEAETQKTQVQTGLLGANVFERRRNALINSGITTPPPASNTSTTTPPGYTGVDFNQ
jgi:hypothetical protein